MPTVTLNKQVFENLVGKTLQIDELKDRISMLGTDLESIEGNDIVVEIFPNRPDLLSEQGFARAFSSFIGVKTGLRNYSAKKSNEKVIVESSVSEIRPYTACAIVKGLNFDQEKIDEVIQIQEKLHVTYGRNRKKAAIGVYPMEKITFPITYKADFPSSIKFQPLESDKIMSADEIIKENKTGKEYGHLLKGLTKFPFFIDNQNNILSMPPIINSHLTGRITQETKDVFVECSGHDFETLSTCLNMIVTALADMGGEIYSIVIEYQDAKEENKVTPNLEPRKMNLDLGYINKRLGLHLGEKEAINLLEKMGFGFEKENKNCKVLIPSYRADILHQVDLVEDIAIAYGYENFSEEIPNVTTIGEETPFEKFANKVREILIGINILEVKNYHLMTKEDLVIKMNNETSPIPLKNALGDHNHLRNSCLPSLMKNLRENQHNEYPQNIFEIGRIFVKGESETGVVETNNLSIILCHEKTDFTQMKQVMMALMSSLGVECSVKESSHDSCIPGRSGDIIVNDTKLGFLGELHPLVLENWELVVPVIGLELDLEKLFELLKN
jgi:phenylalanyl-tRNA synthetase beta chain